MTAKASIPFRRAILSMAAGGVDRHTLQAAAEFARLLQLEILGVFVEDQSLIGLAALPFTRELRLPDYDWQLLDQQRVDDDLRAAALQAERLFQSEVTSKGVASSFEVRRGDPSTIASDVAQPTDVLIVAEPVAILAATTEPMQRAALRSSAAVLLLPRSGLPKHGPVAAVAASRSDQSFALASRIAGSTGEQAFVIPSEDPSAQLLESLQRVLGARRERLLILPRAAVPSDNALLLVTTRRKTPILVLAA